MSAVSVVSLVSLASLGTLGSYFVGGLFNFFAAELLMSFSNSRGALTGILGAYQSPQFSALQPWVALLFYQAVPFALFFWVAGRAGEGTLAQTKNIATVSAAWGLVVAFSGPLLEIFEIWSRSTPTLPTFVAFIQETLQGLTYPTELLGLLSRAATFVTLAVTACAFSYFWRQTAHWSFRDWLNAEPDDEASPDTGEPEPPDISTHLERGQTSGGGPRSVASPGEMAEF